MSKYDELNEAANKVKDIVSICVREYESTFKASSDLEDKKKAIVADIVNLQDRLKELNDSSSVANQELRDKKNELERLTNICKAKIDDYNKKEAELMVDVVEFNGKEKELQDKLDVYNLKNSELAQRENAVDLLNINAQNALDLAEKRIIDSNIEEREQSLSALIGVADDKIAKAKQKEADCEALMVGMNMAKEKAEAEAKSFAEAKEKYIQREADLKNKEAEIVSQRADIARRRQDVDYLNLKVQKIIKDRNIEALVNG